MIYFLAIGNGINGTFRNRYHEQNGYPHVKKYCIVEFREIQYFLKIFRFQIDTICSENLSY